MEKREILDSWKEISAYLGRSIRTCQRLEKELGLPVHRLEGRPKARVYAYRDEIDRWILKTQHSERPAFFNNPILKRLIIPASVSVLLIISTLTFLFLFRNKSATPVPALTNNSTVAVVYFKNNTGDEELEHWRRALCELLIYDIAQSRYIDVLPEDRLFGIMNDLGLEDTIDYTPADLEEISSRGKIDNVIYGNYAKAGNTYRISASIRDYKDGKDIHLEPFEGIGEESFFRLVDEITTKVKENLSLSPEQLASDIDRRIEDISTNFPEALKYYTAGRTEHLKGNADQAITLLKKAIEIDPQFALAYRRMGSAYSNIGDWTSGKEFSEKAFDLRDRVADRERLFIEHSHYVRSEQTYAQALETTKKWHALYPDSYLANAAMGIILWFMGDWDESLKYHEIAYMVSGEQHNVGNTMVALQGNGRYDEAEKVYKTLLRNQPNSISRMFHWIPAYHFLLKGNYDYALEEAERDLLMNPASLLPVLFKADTYHLRGDLEKAEKEYLNLLSMAEDSSLEREARKRLASLYWMQGRFEAAADVLEVVWERGEMQTAGFQRGILNYVDRLAHAYLGKTRTVQALGVFDNLMEKSVLDPDPIYFQRIALWGRCKVYWELHSLDDLRKTSDELSKTAKPIMNMIGRWYISHAEGLLALVEGNLPRAIDKFERVISMLPDHTINLEYIQHAEFLESLGLAYYMSGDLEKAQMQYEHIISLTTGRLFYGDIYAESFYWLGKIHEQQGDTKKAIGHYERFLDLRKNCDPGLVDVEDARNRLAALRDPRPGTMAASNASYPSSTAEINTI